MGAETKRRWPLGALAVIVLLGVGVVIGRSAGAPTPVRPTSTTIPGARQAEAVDDPPANTGPAGGSSGPVSDPGGSPDRVAIRWVSTLAQLLYEDPGPAEDMVRTMTDSDPLVDEVLRDLEANQKLALRADDDTLVWSQWAPLGVQTTKVDSDRVTVKVWGVGVISLVPVVDPVSTWGINVVDLVLIDGDWKVTATETVPGPVFPGPLDQVPVAADAIPSELGGFEPAGAS